MALINCLDCGKPISTSSDNCIHCGTPTPISSKVIIDKDNYQVIAVKNKSSQSNTTLNFIILIAVAAIAYYIGTKNSHPIYIEVKTKEAPLFNDANKQLHSTPHNEMPKQSSETDFKEKTDK